MSKQELADLLEEHTACYQYSCFAFEICSGYKSKEACKKATLAWLESPVEE